MMQLKLYIHLLLSSFHAVQSEVLFVKGPDMVWMFATPKNSYVET